MFWLENKGSWTPVGARDPWNRRFKKLFVLKITPFGLPNQKIDISGIFSPDIGDLGEVLAQKQAPVETRGPNYPRRNS